MIGVTTKLSIPYIDIDDYTKRLDKEMGIIIRGAIRVWVRTLLNSVRGAPFTVGDTFPIQTGRAKAAIRPIARYVQVAVPIRPAPNRKDLTAQGEASTDFQVLDDKSAAGSFEYRFTWETSLEYFLTNEFQRVKWVPSTAPNGWRATVAANKAVQIYIKQQVKARLSQMNPKFYIRTKTE